MSLAVAIKARWEAAGMSAYIPGGLWQGVAETETEFPYQTFVVIGQVFSGRTSTTSSRRAAFEIHTHYKPAAGEDPQEALDAILDATEAAFDDQVLTINDRSCMVVKQNDRRTFDEDAQIYRGLNEFDLKLQKSR